MTLAQDIQGIATDRELYRQVVHSTADSVLTDGGEVITLHRANTLARQKIEAVGALIPRGDWLTSTAYEVKNLVRYAGDYYIVVVDHISVGFATDFAAGRLAIHQNTDLSRIDAYSNIKGTHYLNVSDTITDHSATSGANWDAYNLARLISIAGSENCRIHAPSGSANMGGNTVTIPANIEFTFDHGFVVENGSINVAGPQSFGEILKRAAANPGSINFDVFAALRKLTPRLSDGKKYQLSACVIRNTGSGWAFINDSEHAPVGFTGISVTAGGVIRLDHSFGANKVATMLVVPDETFASMGFQAGGSVGLSLSLITIAAPLEFYVNVATGALTVPDHWAGSITASVGIGYCNVSHPACGEWDMPSISKAGGSAFDSSDFQLSFGPTQTNIIGSGPIDGYISYNGSAWVYTGSLYNVPTMNFSGGLLTVTHPQCDPINISTTPYAGSYRAQPKNLSSTTFEVEFYTSAGVAVTTPDTSMKFFFNRNGYSRRDNLRGNVCVRRGYAPINASKLISTGGNFWVIALHEYL